MEVFKQKCRPITMLVLDVDGVMTDGSIFMDHQGEELKRFHVQDGSAIKLWQASGGRVAIVSGRSARSVVHRAEELGIHPVHQGVKDKAATISDILEEQELSKEQVAFIGDDWPDLPAFRCVGLKIAVANAALELKNQADYVTQVSGGHGAVREAVVTILRAQDRWEQCIAKYL